MKRVEIVVGAVELSEVSGVLDQAGVPGYTVLRDVTGKGDRGDRTGDDALTGALKNGYIFCACNETQARAVAEAVRPRPAARWRRVPDHRLLVGRALSQDESDSGAGSIVH